LLSKATFSYNNLTSLPENLFENCAILKHVNFDSNELKTIPDNLFTGCDQLNHVLLGNNKLQFLPENILIKCANISIFDVDNHLIHTVIPYVNDINTYLRSDVIDIEINLIPLLNYSKVILKFRRNLLDAFSTGWSVRKYAIIHPSLPAFNQK
jgi:Leucine-rich repeat (LRR) protein